MNQPLYESFTVYEPFDNPSITSGQLTEFQDISNNITEINTHMEKIVKINDYLMPKSGIPNLSGLNIYRLSFYSITDSIVLTS